MIPSGFEVSLGLLVAFVLLLSFVFKWINVLPEYERGVIFRLGRVLSPPKGPGLILVFWPIDRLVRVDLRTVVDAIPSQDVITRDNVSVKVNAVVYFRVVDPQAAIVGVEKYLYAMSQLAQTTLRSALGMVELGELLAEREKRAKVIHAEGEFLAAERLAEAASVMGRQPMTLQLRYLQALVEIASERTSILPFPLPIDTLAPFIRQQADGASPESMRRRRDDLRA